MKKIIIIHQENDFVRYYIFFHFYVLLISKRVFRSNLVNADKWFLANNSIGVVAL